MSSPPAGGRPRLLVTLDCVHPAGLAGFWSQALGYRVIGGNGETWVALGPAGQGLEPPLYLQQVSEPKVVKNRQHLDLCCPDPEQAVSRLEAIGATRLGEPFGGRPWRWQVMSDPEGNEFCVVREGTDGLGPGSVSSGTASRRGARMETVSFTAMADGTKEEYEFLRGLERQAPIADHVLAMFETIRGSVGGYQISRYTHALQTATRAHRAGESEEYVVAALLHDLGECIAPDRHGEVAAAVLTPFVSDEIVWIVRHHGLFQMYYYAHHFGADRDVRDQYRDHPYFDACVRFCEIYDQCSFDPDYDTEPVEFFAPMVRRVLGRAEPPP